VDDPLFQLVITLDAAQADAAVGWLFEVGVAGVEERESEFGGTELVIYGPARAALAGLAADAQARWADAQVTLGQLENSDWQTEWTRYLKPESLADSFVIQPSWDATPPPPGRTVIQFEPRLAFGVGSHATTRLVALAVERYCRCHPGCRVLDVGTGTGVLAIVALGSGARFVEATDADPVAVAAATENLRLNGMAERARVSGRRLAELGEPFDLVAANLETPILLDLCADLARLTAPSGQLCLSGVLREQAEPVLAAFAAAGWHPASRETLEGWVALALTRG
jgi:ribosomal protein L11 methyltransferase